MASICRLLGNHRPRLRPAPALHGLCAGRHWSDASDAASTRQAGKPRPDNKGAAHRWQIASRVLAASAGGYLVSAVAMSALALAFPALAGAAPAAGVLTGSLLSFVLYAGIAIGVFAAAQRAAAWAWLAVAGALSGALLLPAAVAGPDAGLARAEIARWAMHTDFRPMPDNGNSIYADINPRQIPLPTQ